jgi:hypothetical protein
MPLRARDELDLIGFDGDRLPIVEVRTRLADKANAEVLSGTAHYFVRERHLSDCPRLTLWRSTTLPEKRRWSVSTALP